MKVAKKYTTDSTKEPNKIKVSAYEFAVLLGLESIARAINGR